MTELYLTSPQLPGAPLRALRGFKWIHLEAGQSRILEFELQPRDLSYVNEAGDRFISAGDYIVTVGGRQPGTTAPQLAITISIRGDQKQPE